MFLSLCERASLSLHGGVLSPCLWRDVSLSVRGCGGAGGEGNGAVSQSLSVSGRRAGGGRGPCPLPV